MLILPQEGGNATGLYNTYAAVDRQNGTRSYSPKAYLCGDNTQSNLNILLGAQVNDVAPSIS